MDENKIMDTNEVMKYLKISRPTVFKLIKEKKIKAAKVGSGWKFFKSDVDDFLKKEINR